MEGNKGNNAYVEAKKHYLAVGKRYSSVLARLMKLDPNILRIAEEILVTGDGLSTHDNRFLTSFYRELRAKSRIDNRYFELLLDLKKTKNELEHATHELSVKRIGFLLRKAGIPLKRTNQTRDIITSRVNDPDSSLLEKISLPGVLDTSTAEKLELLVSSGDIDLKAGTLTPRTKAAREFLKTLEKESQQKVNNDYFLNSKQELLSSFHKLDSNNILEFVRLIGDQDHIREIERKIASKELSLERGGLHPINSRGKKYLSLLTEELNAKLDKDLRSEMLRKNNLHTKTDPRLVRITSSLSALELSESKHLGFSKMALGVDSYQQLLTATSTNIKNTRDSLAELMLLQETIAVSFSDIKKQLVQATTKGQVKIDKVITLLVAVRYLNVFEKEYESKLRDLESMMGIIDNGCEQSTGPDSLAKIRDKYSDFEDDNTVEGDNLVRDIISSNLAGRQALGSSNNKALIKLIVNSPHLVEYRDAVVTQKAVQRHVLDTLYSDNCLYRGMGNVSEVLNEITELELRKHQKVVDLSHELELAHKELWLARIASNNEHYIDTNFVDLPSETRERASLANRGSVDSARKEIKDTLLNYRTQQKAQHDKFASSLRKSLQKITKGGDVNTISIDLKKEYSSMEANHRLLTEQMEKDILGLEKRLVDFEQRTPKEIEKLLMSDIRATI
jgi:hypothetical protein